MTTAAGSVRGASWLVAVAFLAAAVAGASCTSTTGCPAGQTDCSGTCADLQSDPRHCGECSISCATAASCSAGSCACPAPTPDACGLACVDTQTDPVHCGRCGHACGLGTCAAAACVCSTTPATVAYCPAGDPAGSCVDTASNPAFCGSCGTRCIPGESCLSSTCTCVAPNELCGVGTLHPVCTNTQTDARNCGTCAHACAVGQSCLGGVCGATCRAPYTLCSGTCVDTRTDPLHCGACGRQCALGQGCVSGSCSACTTQQCGGQCCPGGTGCCTGPSTELCQSQHQAFPGTANEATWYDCTPLFTYDLDAARGAARAWAPSGNEISSARPCPDSNPTSTCLTWQRQALGANTACAVFCYAGPLQGTALATQGFQCLCPSVPDPNWW